MNPSSNSNEFRDFLLDRLPPERAEAIEERMFQDEAWFSDLQDAEDELIEEYVTDGLNPADEQVFTARIERDAALQDRVALRRALIRTLQSVPAEAVAAAPVARSQPRRRMWSRFLVPGFAMAIVILFFFAYTAEHRNHRPTLATGTAATPAPGSATTRPEAMSQAAAVLFLPAHVARGAAQRPSVLHLGSASLVKLELETPGGDASTRWDVRMTSGGASVFDAAGLASQQAGIVSYVVAQVPVSQLPAKTCQVMLSPESPSGGAVSFAWTIQVVK